MEESSKAGYCHFGIEACRRGRPAPPEDHDARQGADRLGLPPLGEAAGGVRAEEEGELVLRMFRVQFAQGVHRPRRALAPQLPPIGDQPRHAGDRELDHLGALLGRGTVAAGLEGLAGGDHQTHHVQPEGFPGQLRR